MSIFQRIQLPFWKGVRATALFYLLASLIFVLLNFLLPVRYIAYSLFGFIPVVLLTGVVWGIVSLITIRRLWARGALVVHILAILLIWLIFFSRPAPYAENNSKYSGKELMPTFKYVQVQQKFLSNYQKELESWSVPNEEMDVQTEFGKTHVVTFGNPAGKPLVLLHWFSANSLEWKYMAPYLENNYHIYAVDVMGDMGKSFASKPPKTELEISLWFNQVLDSLNLKKVSLCGHSNGGFQSILIAQQNPDRIEKLVLLAPAAVFEPFDIKFFLTIIGTAISPNDYNIKNFTKVCGVKPDQWSNEMTDILALSFRGGAIQVKVFPRMLTDNELKSVRVPTLLMLGDEEFIYSPERSAERAIKYMPNVKVIKLPSCGHAIPFDAPKEASKAIDEFLVRE